MQSQDISIVIPAKNEAEGLRELLPRLTSDFPEAEIVVVDDGSADETADVCGQFPVRVVRHPYSKGNGAAIKSGARAARGEILVFMDADGQHNAGDVQPLLDKLEQGYDMVVGRRNSGSQASVGRDFANRFYNGFASLISGHRIEDLTSGFRAVRRNKFVQFLYLLPNGFSYPTTITMAFFRAGYSVAYLSVDVKKRIGRSHVRPLRDGGRFLLIIFKIGTLYSPLKIFAPLGAVIFILASSHYMYTYLTEDRFTNMSAMLYITALIIFLIGLVSEQITTLIYGKSFESEHASSSDQSSI